MDSSVLKYLLAWCVTRNLDVAKSTTRVQIGDCCDGHVWFEVSVVPLSCWCHNFSSHGSSLHQTKWQLREFFNTCFSLFASKVPALELRAQLKKRTNPPPQHLCTMRQETKPMTQCLQYIMERAPIAASATNPHWHMQPLTAVCGESGPPVWMQRITRAWHNLWINCAPWHAQLTVSNSACDLCAVVSKVRLEERRRLTAKLLDSVPPPPYLPLSNCPKWRWCKYNYTLSLLFLCLVLMLGKSQMQRIYANPSLKQLSVVACAVDYERGLKWRRGCRKGDMINQRR